MKLEPSAVACFHLLPLPAPELGESSAAAGPAAGEPDDDKYRVWKLMHNLYDIYSGDWPTICAPCMDCRQTQVRSAWLLWWL